MISSLFNSTFQILRRQDGSRDSWGKYQYVLSDSYPCMFRDQTGRIIRDGAGKDVDISGVLHTTEVVSETDQIVYKEYVYDITQGGISSKEDLLTGAVEYYKLYLVRRRRYDENPVTINSRVD
jgi:hypothetical protein